MGLPAEKPRRRATYADLEAVPPTKVAEILDGVLHASRARLRLHAHTGSRLGRQARGPVRPGRGRPRGLAHPRRARAALRPCGRRDIVVPDLAGWRIERMPRLPRTAYFALAPDWIRRVPQPADGGQRPNRQDADLRARGRAPRVADPTRPPDAGGVRAGSRRPVELCSTSKGARSVCARSPSPRWSWTWPCSGRTKRRRGSPTRRKRRRSRRRLAPAVQAEACPGNGKRAQTRALALPLSRAGPAALPPTPAPSRASPVAPRASLPASSAPPPRRRARPSPSPSSASTSKLGTVAACVQRSLQALGDHREQPAASSPGRWRRRRRRRGGRA